MTLTYNKGQDEPPCQMPRSKVVHIQLSNSSKEPLKWLVNIRTYLVHSSLTMLTVFV